MANIAPADIYEALPLVDNRISVAANEALRLLRECLPGAIDYVNTKIGRTGKRGIEKPTGYRIAPEALSDKDINSISVAISVETVPEGAGQFRNDIHLVIFSIGERIEAREQVDDAWDRAGIIRGLFYHCLGEWYDPAGRCAWNTIEPLGLVAAVPNEKWADYSVVAISYKVVMANPLHNNWV